MGSMLSRNEGRSVLLIVLLLRSAARLWSYCTALLLGYKPVQHSWQALAGKSMRGQLAHRINSDDATWYIDESKEDGRRAGIGM